MGMKKLIFVIIGLLLTNPVYGESAFKFSISGRENIFQNEELENGEGIEGRVYYKSFYVFGSYDTSAMRLGGQRAGDIEIFGLGLGIETPVVKRSRTSLSISGQVGYFHPESSLPDEIAPSAGYPDGYNEALRHECRRRYLDLDMEHDYWNRDVYPTHSGVTGFGYDISGNIGGAISVHFAHEIIKHLTIGIDVGYRYLQFPETFYASGYIHGEYWHNYLEWKENRDFSGATVGVQLSYRF